MDIKYKGKVYSTLEAACKDVGCDVEVVQYVMDRLNVNPETVFEAYNYTARSPMFTGFQEKDLPLQMSMISTHTKITHAIRRIKGDARWTPNVASYMGDMNAPRWAHLLRMYGHEGFDVVDFEIPDDALYMAVHLACSICDCPEFGDPQTLLSGFCRRNFDLVVVLAILLENTKILCSEYDDVMQKNINLHDLSKMLYEMIAAEDDVEEEDAKTDNLDELEARYQNMIASLQSGHRKDAKALAAEYEARLRSKDKQIKQLEQRLAALEQEESNQGEVVDKELLELPTENVIFYGGHDHVVSKLRALYPKWNFIDGYSTQFDVRNTTAEVVFYTPTQAVHGGWYRLTGMLPAGTPVFRIDATSVGRIISIMQEEYTKYKEGSSNG